MGGDPLLLGMGSRNKPVLPRGVGYHQNPTEPVVFRDYGDTPTTTTPSVLHQPLSPKKVGFMMGFQVKFYWTMGVVKGYKLRPPSVSSLFHKGISVRDVGGGKSPSKTREGGKWYWMIKSTE